MIRAGIKFGIMMAVAHITYAVIRSASLVAVKRIINGLESSDSKEEETTEEPAE